MLNLILAFCLFISNLSFSSSPSAQMANTGLSVPAVIETAPLQQSPVGDLLVAINDLSYSTEAEDDTEGSWNENGDIEEVTSSSSDDYVSKLNSIDNDLVAYHDAPVGCGPRVRRCEPKARRCEPKARHCEPRARRCEPKARHCEPRARRCEPRARRCAPSAPVGCGQAVVRHCEPKTKCGCKAKARRCEPKARRCEPRARRCEPRARRCEPKARRCEPRARRCEPTVRRCAPSAPVGYGQAVRHYAPTARQCNPTVRRCAPPTRYEENDDLINSYSNGRDEEFDMRDARPVRRETLERPMPSRNELPAELEESYAKPKGSTVSSDQETVRGLW